MPLTQETMYPAGTVIFKTQCYICWVFPHFYSSPLTSGRMAPSLSLRLCLLLSVAALCAAAADVPDEWLEFQRRFGRVYRPEEEHFRRQVFSENLERIRQHNVEHDAGRSSFRLGVNQFADFTNEEFRHKILSEVCDEHFTTQRV